MSNIQRGALPPDQERRLRRAARGDDSNARRAQLILRWHEGATLSAISEAVGMSVSGVQYWLRQYRERGIALFDAKESEAPEPEPETAEVVDAVIIEPPKKRRGRPPKIAQPAESEPPPTPAPILEAAEPEAPKRRRGRPPKAAKLEPIPEPIAEAPEPEPPKRRRGRPPKAAKTSPILVAEAAEVPAEPARPAAPITSVGGLVTHYKVNVKHARHVTEQAFFLFDATAEVHHLPDTTRPLLEAGALLHNIAYDIDQAEHHLRGRDIILDAPLTGFSADERRMIALLTAFHRKKVHPEREPVYLALPAELRADTLALAALLRIADGVDNSLTQSTTIAEVQLAPGELLILLEGENAEADAARAQKKADLWERLYNQHVRIAPWQESAAEPPVPARILSAPPAMRDHMPDLVITLDPAMSGIRALRKLALHYTDRLERLAVQVRAGDDRRLPAMVREVDRLVALLGLSLTEQFDGDLRWLAEASYTALVAFNLYDRAAALADDPDDPNAPVVAARLSGWQEAARDALESIDFARYADFMAELRRALVSEPLEDSGALINTLVGPVIWTQLTDLRDVMERGESVSEALAAARHLQDYLLYFRSLLGPEAIQALDMLAPFESYLAAIHMVQAILAALDPAQTRGNHQRADTASEVVRNSQLSILDSLADGLPVAWAAVNSPIFRRALALALAMP